MSCVSDDLAGKCHNCQCGKKRIIAAIPAFGRFPLLRYNIERLYKVNGIYKVIVTGHEPEVQKICAATGAEFVQHRNRTLGLKWNKAFQEAKKHNPDAVLFVGSSDLISKDWLTLASKYLNDYDMIGKLGCHLLDINSVNGMRLLDWPGYQIGPRAQETIGIGRVISARILNKFNWRPFNDAKDNSMDKHMEENVLRHGGKIKVMDEDVYSMAISTDKWENKHKFEQHYQNLSPTLKSEKILGQEKHDFLKKHFEDIYTLKL